MTPDELKELHSALDSIRVYGSPYHGREVIKRKKRALRQINASLGLRYYPDAEGLISIY